MKEEYVTYPNARTLKRIGFDESCEYYYNPDKKLLKVKSSALSPQTTNNSYLDEIAKGMATAPRLDQAQAWLRDCKDTIVIAEPDWDEEIQCLSDYLTGKWYFTVWKDSNRVRCNFNPNKECEEIWLFDTYEQALSAGIDKALELLTIKSNGKWR